MKITETKKCNKDIFRSIFKDHWEEFKELYPSYNCDQYEEPVQKMFGCGKESGGYSEHICLNCGRDIKRVCFTCKSCFCLSCAKGYVDNFVSQVSKILHPGVIYRHIVLTIPEQLREIFYRYRHDGTFLTEFMRCGYECLEDTVSTLRRQSLKIGVIIVVQTHGRSGRYNPHLHIIMTDGGINEEKEKWVKLGYFRYEMIHKKWQYHLFSMLKRVISTIEIKQLINELYKKYPKGLVANVQKGRVPESCKGLAKYLAKYVACPPIAVRRIVSYDGQKVRYYYQDHKTKSRQFETVDAITFIYRMVQHIMPKWFQRVRYFGLQATKTFKKWCKVIKRGLSKIGRIVQGAYQVVARKKYRERYKEVSGRDPLLCRYCGSKMELWKIWHPKYGVIFDEWENLKSGKYGSVETEDYCKKKDLSQPSSKYIQLLLFPLPVRI